MKKLLWIVVLGLVLSGNAFANIFNCVIDDYNFSGNQKVDISIVIDVDNLNKSALATTRSNVLDFTADDFILTSAGHNGKLIITSSSYFIKKGSYNLFVSSNSKKGDPFYFKGIFSENARTDLIHTVIIEVWSPSMPIYLFLADSPKKVLKGTCN